MKLIKIVNKYYIPKLYDTSKLGIYSFDNNFITAIANLLDSQHVHVHMQFTPLNYSASKFYQCSFIYGKVVDVIGLEPAIVYFSMSDCIIWTRP